MAETVEAQSRATEIRLETEKPLRSPEGSKRSMKRSSYTMSLEEEAHEPTMRNPINRLPFITQSNVVQQNF